MEEFYNACRIGNISKVEEIIKLKNLYQFDFNWGLANACEGGHLQIVERMIELGANSSIWALHTACRGGNLLIVERMIELSTKSENGGLNQDDFNFGLAYACSSGHLRIVERMIELGADDFNWGLFCACKNGYLQIAERMIELGAKFTNSEFYSYNNHIYKHEYRDYLKSKKIMYKLFITDLVNEIISYI